MRKIITRASAGVAGLAALALGGAAIAGANSGASSTSSTATPTTSAAPAAQPQGYGTSGAGGRAGPGFPANEPPGSAAHEAAEKTVTGEAAEKAKAAALASVPGTAGAVTTDFRGSGYEVAVTKSDGTAVTVHLDGSFKVQTMPGPGGAGGPGHGVPPTGAPAPGQGPSYGQAPPAA